MITLDATFNRRVVSAAVGDLLRLDLPEDVAAGNRWVLPDPLPPQLRLTSDKTADCSNQAAGGRRLEFRVVAQGRFALSLVNARDWQQPATRFEVFVEVNETDSDLRLGPQSSKTLLHEPRDHQD